MAEIELPEGHEPERTRMWQLVPELGEAASRFSHAMDAGALSTRERELARMRIAQLDACPI